MSGDGQSWDSQVTLVSTSFIFVARFEPSYDMPNVMYYQVKLKHNNVMYLMLITCFDTELL